jgi:1-acyl-sn-glycerol-3-phosphate acyltransferase
MGPAVPRRNWRIGRWIGRTVFKAAGWSFPGSIPDIPKAVIIVAPHTSNWDFVIGAAAMLAMDLDARFFGKHTLFKGPLGVFMRFLGGVPVDRGASGSGVVEDMVARFEAADRLILALAPEGTRKAVDHWKTGFHRIALAAGVPIVPTSLDWGRRQIRFGEPFMATDDAASDVAELLLFFADSRGRRQNAAVESRR